MNYVQNVSSRLAAELPDCDGDLIQLYTLLALTTGADTTLKNVHDAWSLWRNTTRPDHPSLIPFGKLSREIQQLDAKYADAIRRVAASFEDGEPVLEAAPAGAGTMKYATLAELKAAYDSGELDRENALVLDNDSTSVWGGDDEAFEAHPAEVLRQALELLGIPWETC